MTIENAEKARELLKVIEDKEKVLNELQVANNVYDITFTTGNKHVTFERVALTYETMFKIHAAVKEQYEKELEEAKKQLENL